MTTIQFTPKLIDFIIQAKRNGEKFTRDDIKGFNRYSWYLNTSFLKSNSIIQETGGINDRNQKIWKLTDSGISIAEKFIEIEGILNKIEERMNNG